ncbi:MULTISPECIES: thiamine pyrophosphate-binding protein [Streptomyces]|uniref:Thiamine pyrophosphate-binding protein n=1 Tax=Streptomyces changanensis TaxID=2964669 RepID=A0ABY5N3L8_9ACTN|nr:MULTISPECIES: thiamine pyrophosphate-dependent enzyme [Streptomyces]UUS31125.1 thiamine pyrophosphate-binding protein [Streptomyces changanensis]
MRSSPRVVDFVVDFLQRQEVSHVFGVGGANIEDLYDALHHAQAGPLGVVAKHEFSAATMADGYHRASQRVPVIAATSGAGAMNLVPGIAELRASYVPALVLIGQPPAALDGRGSFQETSGLAGSIDAARMFAELAVYCVRVDDPESIVRELPRALAAATDPAAPGPAVLLLPKDVQQAVIPSWDPPAAVAPAALPLSDAAERSRAAGLLRAAARRGGVAVIAGEAVARADARPQLARLTAALGAAVAVVPDAKDVADPRDPGHLGIAGAIGTAEVQEALERASAVLLAGTRLPQMAGAGLHEHLKGVPVVCVDPREPFLGAHEELVRLTGPVAAELELLEREVTTASGPAADRPTSGPAAEHPAPGRTARQPGPAPRPVRPAAAVPDPATSLDLRTAALTVAAHLPEGATVVADAGNTGAAAIHHVDVPPGGRFIAALGMGGMGHSFGAGVGAAFATGRRTCVIAGDGAFFMHGMEVHTAVEHDLPVTFVVLNNNAHGMCATREQLFFSGDYSYNLFRPARIGDGAAAMFPGLAADTVRTAGELGAALDRAHATSSPALVCVDVDPTEMPPFRPFRQHVLLTGRGRPVREGAVPG